MSTHRGIAVVTETLRFMLTQAAAAVPNTTVRVGHPEGVKPGGGPTVNIFLYQVHTTQTRHADLSTRDPADRLPIELDLDYILSFAGAENTPEPELLLGATVAQFETTPEVTQSIVEDALSSQSGLRADELSYPVRIGLLDLSTDERSRLWSGFFQVPYRLSVEYRIRTMFLPA